MFHINLSRSSNRRGLDADTWALSHNGGFTYGIDEEGERVGFDDFKRLLGLPFSEYQSRYMNIAGPSQIAFPMIAAAEICDKARGDFFSKAIFDVLRAVNKVLA